MNDKQRVQGVHQETLSDDGDEMDEQASYKEWLANGRYDNNIYGLTVMEAKYKALKCVESLFNHAFNVKLRFLLSDFKHSIEGATKLVRRWYGGCCLLVVVVDSGWWMLLLVVVGGGDCWWWW